MYQNEKQYVKDNIELLQNDKVLAVLMLLNGIFAITEGLLIYANWTWWPDYLTYLIDHETMGSYWSTFLMYPVFILALLIFILTALRHYLTLWNSRIPYADRCLHASLFSLCAIPGYLSLVYACSSVRPIPIDMMDTALYSIIASIIFFIISYIRLQHKIHKEILIYQKNTMKQIQNKAICVLVAIMLLQFALPESMATIPLCLIFCIPCLFLSYGSCRFFIAYRLYHKLKEEFIEYEALSYNGDPFDDHTKSKERLYIINSGRLLDSLNIMEEFGFDPVQVQRNILANEAVHTFVEGMYLNTQFLHILLQRLTYEGISYKIEYYDKGNWIPWDETNYELIEPENIHRRKKLQELSKATSNNILHQLIMIILPANLYRPVNWMSLEQVKKSYRAFTYPNKATVLHTILPYVLLTYFLSSTTMQSYVLDKLDLTTTTSLWIIFAFFFFIELFHFPIYLRRMKEAIDLSNRSTHNYFLYAFLLYLLSTLRRIISRGIEKGLIMLTILIVSIECARSLILIIRFLRNRKQEAFDIDKENYEFYIP